MKPNPKPHGLTPFWIPLSGSFKSGIIGRGAGGITGGLLGYVGGQGWNWFERGLAHGVIQGGASEATRDAAATGLLKML
jgi:hypothetical protein